MSAMSLASIMEPTYVISTSAKTTLRKVPNAETILFAAHSKNLMFL